MMRQGGELNVETIAKHMKEVMARHRPKIRRCFMAERVSISNLAVNIDVPHLPYHTFAIGKVVVADVGKQRHGVTLVELFAIVVRAAVSAMLTAAEQDAYAKLAGSMGSVFEPILDAGALSVDIGGRGLRIVGGTVGFASGVLGGTTKRTGKIAGGVTRRGGGLLAGVLGKSSRILDRVVPGSLGSAVGYYGTEAAASLRSGSAAAGAAIRSGSATAGGGISQAGHAFAHAMRQTRPTRPTRPPE
eukprot:TRINITY_DN24752_c0_g1_i1.p2 TRINITY_DN24752_c0_g1~~TRINITY_DN24752_c0_g1_i1.p2  ORF type:complete len:245 (+),score=65.28 TRINITY_DN24752_c0_g1_i1:468-1202(+)